MVSADKKGLTGEEIPEEKAKEIAKNFLGASDEEIGSKGLSENGDIVSYDYEIGKEDKKSIMISKKGGHVVYMNYYREIGEEKISEEEAVEIRKKFLK